MSSKVHPKANSKPETAPEEQSEHAKAPESLEEVIDAIGAKIRGLRLQKGYSLQQLAERAGVSAAAVHKIERNGMVPTITTLMKIAMALNRPVAYFVAEDIEVDKPVVHTTPENRRRVFTSKQGLDLKSISGPYGRFFLAGAVAVVSPHADSGKPPMAHPGEELVYLLKGKLTFELEGGPITLEPGDSLHFRGDRKHRWKNPSSKAAEAVWLALRPM